METDTERLFDKAVEDRGVGGKVLGFWGHRV